jgi:hypothetical protein
MASSTFSGPIQAGTIRDGSTNNVGKVVLSQTAVLNQNSTTAVSNTFYLPANAQLLDIIADVLTAFNSATTAVLSVGSAAAGTQYAGSIDAKTAGRTYPTYSAAQLAAMDGIGSNTSVVATITPDGATSAGQVRVTLQYVQN